MPTRFVKVLLIMILSAALARDARAEGIQTAADQIVTGIVVVSAGVAVGVTLLILHEKHKKDSITGCINPAANGLAVTDEKDKRTYAVTGNPPGVKPGERMTLEGKRAKDDGNMPVFKARSVIRDLGACQP